MVYAYYEIGRLIIEDEQNGARRAEYGKSVLIELSKRLTQEFGKGFSKSNLEQMRQFYMTYTNPQTLSVESTEIAYTNPQTLSRKSENTVQFTLSWSHYVKLMRIKNPDERQFYEIESAKNNWSLRELQRQFDSALYERLVLSRDKLAIKSLAEQGQIIEKPTDILKDPYILEFLVFFRTNHLFRK